MRQIFSNFLRKLGTMFFVVSQALLVFAGRVNSKEISPDDPYYQDAVDYLKGGEEM